MRSFELCESPPRADHMTTKLGQAHMSTHAHWGALIPKTTLARMYISIKHGSEYRHEHINSVFFAAALHHFRRIQYCPSTLALQACRAWQNICSQVQQEHPWVCGIACQQKRRPRIQGWLLRQAVINEAHKRQRGLFFLFVFLLGQQLHMFFYRSTGFKVFRLSKMTHLLFEGLLHHRYWRDPRSFFQGLSFCSDPSSCQNIQRYNFRFPSQLSDSRQACQGASNQCKLLSWREMLPRVIDAWWTQTTVI